MHPVKKAAAGSAHREELRAVVAVLASLRQKQGISQLELSKRLGLQVMTVSKIESGFRDMTFPEFLDIARELAVEPVELIRRGVGSRKRHSIWSSVPKRSVLRHTL